MKKSHSPLQILPSKFLAVAFLVAFSAPFVQAQTWTPTTTGTYDWNNDANWNVSPFPNAVDAAAALSVDFGNPQTVDLNEAITVGSLIFTDNGGTTGKSTFDLAAGTSGSLVLQTSSGNALVSIVAPSTSRQPNIRIASDILVNSNSTFDTASDGSSSKQFSLSGSLSGSGTITKDGSKGRLAVTGDNSAFTGNWILDGGVSTSYFRINADNNLGAVPASSTNNIIVNGNNTMEFGAGNYTIDANRDILVNSGSLGLAPTAWNTYVTIAGDISGAGGITRTTDKGPNPYFTLTGNNTYTGRTIISSGRLRAGSSTAFGVDSEVVMGTGQYDVNGILDLNDFNNSIGSLSGGNATKGLVDLGSATLTTGSNDMSTNYAGIIYGTGGLTKVGTGTMTLDGDNTYEGVTTINGGALIVNGGLDSSAVTLASGAAIGGTGLMAGDLTLGAGANFVFSITDTLSVTGAVGLDSTFGVASLVNSDLSAVDWSSVDLGTYTLIDTTSTDFAVLGIQNFGSGSAYDLGDGKSAYFQSGSLQLVVIPEPSTFLLVSFFMLTLVAASRSRKRS